MVALPLALETMIARLEEGYYRQAASILHDARVIASNAALFNGPGSELAADGRGTTLVPAHSGLVILCMHCLS